MDRRKFLTCIGSAGLGGVAGCTGPLSSPGTSDRNRNPSSTPSQSQNQSPTASPDPPTSETPTERTPTNPSNSNDIQRYVSLEDVDDVPSEYNVNIDVNLIRSKVTDSETARLSITTTNTGSRRSISVLQDKCGLLNRAKGRSDQPKGLWLYIPQRTEHIPREGDHWEADWDPDKLQGYPDYACGMREYTAGESLKNEYVLWDDYQIEGYMEPGTYRWNQKVSVSKQGTPTETSSQKTFIWGFEVNIEL